MNPAARYSQSRISNVHHYSQSQIRKLALLAVHQATSIMLGCYGLAKRVQLTSRYSSVHIYDFFQKGDDTNEA
jgi:hypothetical protein